MLNTFRAVVSPLHPRRIAAGYDSLGVWIFNANMMCNKGLAQAFEKLHAGEGERFYDIGYGGGRHIPEYLSGKEYIGIDISPVAQLAAKWMDENQKEPRATFTPHVGDAQNNAEIPMTIADGAMFAYSLSAMQHPERAVANIAARVRPQGRVVIIDYINNAPSFGDELKAFVARRSEFYDPSRSIDEITGEAPLHLIDVDKSVPKSGGSPLAVKPTIYTFERA